MPVEVFVLILICPYHAFFMAWRDRYWEALPNHPLLWISLLLYLGTTFFAAIKAYRLEFRKYRLLFATNAWAVFLGCLFSWGLFSWFFIRNWGLVASGRAVRRDSSASGRRFDIFCLYLAGVAWTLLLQFMGGAAIPGIMLSRWQHNEYEAMALLKRYAEAQAEFRKQHPEGVYCDDYRLLRYGPERTFGEMANIPVAFSPEERETAVRRSLTPGDGGYVFLEDPYVTNNSLWATRFGLVAYPTLPGRSGRHVFWIGEEGKVLFRYGGGAAPFAEEESPLHRDGAKLWE